MTAAAPTSAALAAFLRGVERRAALLAGLQCGDFAAGDAALAAAMRAFAAAAPRQPLAGWPVCFWGLLLAAPQLRSQPSGAAWQGPWRPLAGLNPGLRAGLLLRLAAGVEQDVAAAALGVAPAACDAALRRALDQLAATGAPAPSTWECRIQEALKAMPAARLAQLARWREQALVATATGTAAAQPSRQPAPPGRVRWRRSAWAGLVLCGLALAATFVRPGWFMRDGGSDPRIRTEPLPPADAPMARFDASLRAWSHRDFELLADPGGLREARRLPLLAWHAAQLATQAAAAPALDAVPSDASAALTPLPLPVDTVDAASLPPAAPQGIDLSDAENEAIARLPAPLQPGLRAQAARWNAWTAQQRNDYRQRQAVWDAQPPAARGEQREAYAAWRALDPASRQQVRAAARDFDARPPEQREGLRARFMAQDASTQRGWLLGPALGADYPRLQPLIAQLPEAVHAPALAVLRALPAGERGDLAILAQRTPPQARAELLRELLSTSEANRTAWLQARLAR